MIKGGGGKGTGEGDNVSVSYLPHFKREMKGKWDRLQANHTISFDYHDHPQ